MQKNKKNAFTLAEVLLALMIIGIVAACLARVMKSNNYKEKGNTLMAYKAIETVSSVSSQIRQTETEVLPTGKFMIKNAGGTYEYAVLSTDGGGKLAPVTELAGMFGDYMKKDGSVINFCSVSGACSNNNIKGFRLPGDLYIGFELFSAPADCPSFYMPDNKTTAISAGKNFDGTTKKCWGKLYIDTNGAKGPNTLNEDYYVFGMDENGVVTGS